jgi:hypothetical protein
MPPTSLDKDLRRLEAQLKLLEAEYNKFFAGRLAKPPWEIRANVEWIVKQYDRGYIANTGDRFRFQTLQSRFATLVELWDRGLRAREEGRPGPFTHTPAKAAPASAPSDRVLYVASFRDPVHEMEKLTDLYESLTEARRAIGQDPVPFHRFADLVRTHVTKLRQSDGAEVAFRVAVRNGKVVFTAKALKGLRDADD